MAAQMTGMQAKASRLMATLEREEMAPGAADRRRIIRDERLAVHATLQADLRQRENLPPAMPKSLAAVVAEAIRTVKMWGVEIE